MMGRKSWQVSVIDKANEDFRLLHFAKPTPSGKTLHYFDKDVTIFLDSKVLSWLSSLTRLFTIEFDRVKYRHVLAANNRMVEHKNDEKQFGVCQSRTSWVGETSGFTIRWYLKQGLLKVDHHVNARDQLEVRMHFTKPDKKTCTAVKIYDRVPFTAEDDVYRQQHSERQYAQ